jgi:[ribosomal protein S5]-alanine N-acetyltransferase
MAGLSAKVPSVRDWPDDGVSRDQRGFWLDPEFQGRGLMTEAAERVTAFAFIELGWPHLWLSNAEANGASGRIKEKQGAQLIDRMPFRFVDGEGTRMVWLLRREDWLALSSHAHLDRERPARS